jgi:hypothetical protein
MRTRFKNSKWIVITGNQHGQRGCLFFFLQGETTQSHLFNGRRSEPIDLEELSYTALHSEEKKKRKKKEKKILSFGLNFKSKSNKKRTQRYTQHTHTHIYIYNVIKMTFYMYVYAVY